VVQLQACRASQDGGRKLRRIKSGTRLISLLFQDEFGMSGERGQRPGLHPSHPLHVVC